MHFAAVLLNLCSQLKSAGDPNDKCKEPHGDGVMRSDAYRGTWVGVRFCQKTEAPLERKRFATTSKIKSRALWPACLARRGHFRSPWGQGNAPSA